MKLLRLAGCASALACILVPGTAAAGGFQETIDLTDQIPSPVAGEFITPTVFTRYDPRCIPVVMKVNSTQDPIPNPLGPGFLSVAEVAAVMQQAADVWNAVPTSFIDVRIDGTTANPRQARTDQINEITFRTSANFPPSSPQSIFAIDHGAVATVRSTRLVSDFTFTEGFDIDGDGDPDATAAIATCQDFDGDGDFELPVGHYEAGTILESDIIFNAGVNVTGVSPPGFRFTTGAAQADTDPRSVDLLGVAVQALGIAHAIAHVPTSQKGPHNGAGATMFPFIDTSDPQAELALRALDTDAVTSISAFYPEGSASDGPAALEPGDVAFESAFGFITGEVHDQDGTILLGGHLSAIDQLTGEVVSTAINGFSQFSTTPNGQNATFLDIGFHGIDGKYRLVVPPGLYRIALEASDAEPARHFNFNLQTFLSEFLFQNTFEEELYNGAAEGPLERNPGQSTIVRVRAGETVAGIDLDVNRTTRLASYGSFDRRGPAGAQPGSYLAVRIPKASFLAADANLGGHALILGGAFLTAVEDASVVPLFAEALLTTGRVNPNGTATLDLKSPLAKQKDFAGQDFDFAPLWFDNSVGLTQKVRNGIAQGKIEDLFLVLRLPAGPFPGPSGAAPRIGLDGGVTPNDVPIGGSFRSASGAVFQPDGQFNYMFKLILGEDPR